MNARKQRIEALFDAALELSSAEQREVYLSRAAGDDVQLRQEVEALIRAYEKSGEFLAAQTEAPDKGTIAASPRPAAVTSEEPGDAIGRYKLLQKIGEGGCGVVYMAEQEEPVRRRVALKIIKLGMDTKSVISRFEAERQALAIMDHPNIAKVHDAGATETGRPYFVMELIRGVKITDYCDEQNLSTRDRLELFGQVCHAVQHAHQKGIIHRDIKPSNVLVTVNDGVATPKVIDFGIAKATTDVRLTDKTVFTAFEQFIGTPAYMSPEQAEITSVDVDTRSDIYSLGVLLYELLTGKTPFDAAELLKVGLHEMRRTIREVEPVKPSTRLSQSSGARSLSSPVTRHSPLATDLDWIVMKCLEKDRARRYETANGLVSDIERHLSNEPVMACPPSNLYRFQKLVRRNRVKFGAVAALGLSIIGGFSVSTWLFLQERAAKQQQARLRTQAEANEIRAVENEKKAQVEAGKRDQAARFMERMLEGVGPSVAMGRDTTILREILEKASTNIGLEFTNQPEVELDLRATISQVYEALGEYGKAEALYRQSLDTARQFYGNRHQEIGWLLAGLARGLRWQSRNEEAEAAILEAMAIFREIPVKEEREGALAYVLDTLGGALRWQGKLEDSEIAYQESLELQRKLRGSKNPAVASALMGLAIDARDLGRPVESEAMIREALELLQSNHFPEEPLYLHNLAVTLESESKLSEAEDMYKRCQAILLNRLGDRPDVNVGTSRFLVGNFSFLASVLQNEGKTAEAAAVQQEALAFLQKTAHIFEVDTRLQTADSLQARGEVFARLGRWKEAAADLTRLRDLRPADTTAWDSLLAVLIQDGQLVDYHEHCRRGIEKFANSNDPKAANRIARGCLILPPSTEDLQVLVRMVHTTASLGPASRNRTYFHFCNGLLEYRQGNFLAAADWMQKTLSRATGPNAPITLRILRWDPVERDVAAQAVLAMAYQQLNRYDEARSTLSGALVIAETKLAKLGNSDLGYDWIDWVIAHTLLREARELIEGGVRISARSPSPGSDKSRFDTQSPEVRSSGSNRATAASRPRPQ